MRVQVECLLTSEFTFAEQAGALVRHLFETYPSAIPHTLHFVRLGSTPRSTLYARADIPGVGE